MRRFRWVASILVFVVSILVFLAVASNRRNTVTLPSGLIVQWLGVTEGTNAYVDGNILQKLLGERIPARGLNLGFTTLARPKSFQPLQETGHVAWFRLSGKNPSPPSYEPLGYFRTWDGFKVFFRNSGGRELEIPHATSYTSSSSNALFSIPMVAYPRDESKVILRIGTPPDGKTEQQWAEFEFKTPARVKQLPTWNLQSLPATNHVDGWSVVLRSASASSSELVLSLPSSEWSVPECRIFDQEGNQYSWSRTSGPTPPNPDCAISFPDSFGADRPWHLRLQLVHARGFVKRRFDNLPQGDFPEAARRRLMLSPGAPPVPITNNLGEVFSCVLEGQQLKIKGKTSARPFWAVISASNGATDLEINGCGWQNPSPREPLGQQIFFLPQSVTNLSVELACPQILSTEFYFTPAR